MGKLSWQYRVPYNRPSWFPPVIVSHLCGASYQLLIPSYHLESVVYIRGHSVFRSWQVCSEWPSATKEVQYRTPLPPETTQGTSCLSLSLPQPPTAAHLITVNVFLSFTECRVVGIVQYVVFSDWCVSLFIWRACSCPQSVFLSQYWFVLLVLLTNRVALSIYKCFQLESC